MFYVKFWAIWLILLWLIWFKIVEIYFTHGLNINEPCDHSPQQSIFIKLLYIGIFTWQIIAKIIKKKLRDKILRIITNQVKL